MGALPAIPNVEKHAGATQVEVAVRMVDGGVHGVIGNGRRVEFWFTVN
ncbi:MAG TPA: hypothetical protein VFD88_06765 [Clostridia bacterium]|nr:hypothetical protein [Clostridia bacterium]